MAKKKKKATKRKAGGRKKKTTKVSKPRGQRPTKAEGPAKEAEAPVEPKGAEVVPGRTSGGSASPALSKYIGEKVHVYPVVLGISLPLASSSKGSGVYSATLEAVDSRYLYLAYTAYRKKWEAAIPHAAVALKLDTEAAEAEGGPAADDAVETAAPSGGQETSGEEEVEWDEGEPEDEAGEEEEEPEAGEEEGDDDEEGEEGSEGDDDWEDGSDEEEWEEEGD